MMLKRILCGVFGFFLTLSLIVPQLFVTFHTYYFDQETLISALCNEDIARQTYDSVLSDANEYAMLVMLPDTVFEDVFSVEQIQDDLTTALLKGLEHKSFSPDLEQSKAKLDSNVRAFLAGVEDFGDPDNYNKQIDVFVRHVAEAYDIDVNLSVFETLYTIKTMVSGRLQTACYIAAALFVFCLFFLWKLVKNPGGILRELSFSMIAAAVCNWLLAYLIHDYGVLTQIQVNPLFFRSALGDFLQNGLLYDRRVAVITGVIGVVLFVAAAVLIALYNRKLPRRTSHSIEDAEEA